MRRPKKDKNKENEDLIRSFIDLLGLREDYEVWVPYNYRGILGFIDLVIDKEGDLSLFKFVHDAQSLEEAVKSLKLETAIYPKSRNTDSDDIDSYLIIEDSKKNRRITLSQERLLDNQPFEILLLDKNKKHIEAIYELKYTIPRQFKAKDITLSEKALDSLIEKPNHTEVEEAILNLDNPPKSVSEDFVRKTHTYVKRNDELPENLSSLKKETEGQEEPSYRTQVTNSKKEAKHT